MSLCPSNDIHSVYLDNELPQEFLAEYEAHVNSCPKCQSELNKLKVLSNVLRTDSKEITPDAHYLDESFNRLQIKMSYSKTTKNNNANFNFKSFSYVAMAAAAVVAFAFIVPLRLHNSSEKVSGASGAVASIPYAANGSNVSFDSGRSVVISGNIDGTVLSSVKSHDSNFSYHNYGYNCGYGHNGKGNHNRAHGYVEVFRPKFSGDQTISIKVTFPGMNEGPIPSDLQLPENVRVFAGISE